MTMNIPNNLLRIFLFVFMFLFSIELLFATSQFNFKPKNNHYEFIYDDSNCSVYNVSSCNFCSPGTIYNDSKMI
jgi:hypothetical protein